MPLGTNKNRNNEEEFIFAKNEMEETLIVWNSIHLHQVHGIKVVQSRYVEELRRELVKKNILQGEYRS